MTKQEAIKATGYTEEDLSTLALQMAKTMMRDARSKSDDMESWDHYDSMVMAYEWMLSERGEIK